MFYICSFANILSALPIKGIGSAERADRTFVTCSPSMVELTVCAMHMHSHKAAGLTIANHFRTAIMD